MIYKIHKSRNQCGQYHLAVIYEAGDAIKQNFIKAIYLFKKFANQGNSGAQWKLGYLFLSEWN